MEGMGRLHFLDLFTELAVPPQAAGVVGTFNVRFFFIILSTTVSVLDLKDAILFLQSLIFLCTLTLLILQVHSACVLCI